jgi:hypothetical protein
VGIVDGLMQEKLTTLAEAIARIDNGNVVALQNMATQAAPMALVRELIRQEKRGLGLVVLVGGLAVDWLAASGVIDRLIGAAVSMEQFGLCQQYRKAVESGRIRVEEISETILNARLGAGAWNRGRTVFRRPRSRRPYGAIPSCISNSMAISGISCSTAVGSKNSVSVRRSLISTATRTIP